MSALPEIFAGVIDGPARADVMASARSETPAQFAARWREMARAAARDGRKVVAQSGGAQWRLAGGSAVNFSGRRVAPETLSDAALFVEGDPPSTPGGVRLETDEDHALAAALWGDPPGADSLAPEADGERGGLSFLKMRTLGRLRGLRGRGLDELCARFSWHGGETDLPAGEAILALRGCLDDTGDVAVFSRDPLFSGETPDPVESSLDDYTLASASHDAALVEADARDFAAGAAAAKFSLRETMLGLERLGALADSLSPGDYAGDHEDAVREALSSGRAVAPAALASHPHLLAPDRRQPGVSLRPFVTLRLGGGFVPEVIVPTGGGGMHVFSRDDLAEIDPEAAKDLAVADWREALAARGVPAAEVEDMIAPFSRSPDGVPEPELTTATVDGEEANAVAFGDALVTRLGADYAVSFRAADRRTAVILEVLPDRRAAFDAAARLGAIAAGIPAADGG